MPAPSRDLAAYEQDYAATRFEAVQARYRKRLLLDLLAQRRPRSVLEVGCGLDTLANHWPHAERFVVVEPAAGFAEAARAGTEGRRDVEVVEALLEDAGLTETFDLVLLSGLLGELPDPAALLRDVHGLCAPDTLVHVNVANARSFHRLLALEMGLIQSLTELSAQQVRLQQQRTYTLDALVELVRDCGYEVVESGSFFVKPFTHAQMELLQTSGVLTDAMLDGLWGMTKHLPELGSEIYVNLRRVA